MVGPDQRYSSKPGLLQRPPALLPSEPRTRLKHSIPSTGMLGESAWEARSMPSVNERGSHFREDTSLLGGPHFWSQNQSSGSHYLNTADHQYVSERSHPVEVTELKDSVEDFIGTVMSVIHSKLVTMMKGKDEIEQQDLLDGLISIIGRAGRSTEMRTPTSTSSHHSQGIGNDRSSLLGPPPLLQDSILDKYSDSPQLLRKMLPALHKKLLEIEPNRSGLLGDHPLFRSNEMKALMKQYARRVNDHMIDSSQLGLLGEHPLGGQANTLIKDNYGKTSSTGVLGSHPLEKEGIQRQSGLLGSHPLEYEPSLLDKPHSYGLLGDHPKLSGDVGLLGKEPLFSETGRSFEMYDRNQGLLGAHPLSRESLSSGKQIGLLGDYPGRLPGSETRIQQSGLLGDHPLNESLVAGDYSKPGLLGAIPGLDNNQLPNSDAIHYHIQAARRKKPLIDMPMAHSSLEIYSSSSFDSLAKGDYPGLLGDEPLMKRARLALPHQEVNSGIPYSQQPSLLGDYPVLPFQRPSVMMHSQQTRSSESQLKQRMRSRDQERVSSHHLRRDHEPTNERKRSTRAGYKKNDNMNTKSSRRQSEKSEPDTGSVGDFSSDNESDKEYNDPSNALEQDADYDSVSSRKYSDSSEESD